MASNTTETPTFDHDSLQDRKRSTDGWELMQQLLAPLASLKLTVFLLFLGIVIVFVGTLAQVDKDIWEVINEYFRATDGNYIVWIKPSVFFPPAFFPEGGPAFPDKLAIPFPKGWLIGIAMLNNLMAAHLVRFKVQATGPRLWGGWFVILLGSVLTTAVIVLGSGKLSDTGYQNLWRFLGLILLTLCGVSAFATAILPGGKGSRRPFYGALAMLLAGGAIWILQADPLNADAMRILMQLVLATGASTAILAGCLMVFKNRGGIVLIHAGVGLMMVYEVIVGYGHVESRMQIEEGQTVNYSSDIRTPELAFIETSDASEDVVTVIPGSRLLKQDAVIEDPLLPVRVKVLNYLPNSTVRNKKALGADKSAPPNPATDGIGVEFSLLPQEKSAGTDTGGGVDIPGAYVEFLDPVDGKSLGVLLLTPNYEASQPIEVGGKTYHVELRFRRIYYPYWITLNDVQKNDYKGTNNPRDYSSFIEVDAAGGKFDQRIWMNNPMRYAGVTLYQSSYVPAGATGARSKEATVLQVVSNRGWMAPYVACMMVVVGMLAHFGVTLLRFLDRAPRRNPAELVYDAEGNSPYLKRFFGSSVGLAGAGAGLLLFLIAGAYIGSKARTHSVKAGELDIVAFGELPMWYKGRAMPIDTFARNALLQLSDREAYIPPSTAWMIELSGEASAIKDHTAEFETFIDSLEFTAGDPKYDLPAGWTVKSSSEADEPASQPAPFATLLIPNGQTPLELTIRDEVYFVSEYEGFSQTQVSRWRENVGLPPVTSYSWRAEMRAADTLREAPLAEGGRIRQALDISNAGKQQLAALITPTSSNKSQTATHWLLTLMADEAGARRIPVFRIENADVIESLGLDKHRFRLTYSMEDLQKNFEALAKEAQAAGAIPPKQRNLREKKIVELANRVIQYRFLEQTIGRTPALPNQPEFGGDDPQQRRIFMDRFATVNREALDDFMSGNDTGPLPLMVPVHVGLVTTDPVPATLKADWETLSTAWIYAQYFGEQKSNAAPAVTHLCALIDAAATQDAKTFNAELAAYNKVLQQHFSGLKANAQKARDDLPLVHTVAEARFNRMEMFSNLAVFYVFSLVIAFIGWLVAPQFSQRCAFVLSLGLLVMYTYALYMRMYISGRPPVTNLYSSAIFIGWATVLGGLIMEAMSWKGFGNVVAAATGFAALRIADGLATDGDTIAVMEAVLDTQFWLATHVVCITLGYATTFLAGALGVLYLLRGMATKVSRQDLDDVGRMMYGTLCFATFFSFFGTVLGGLWADDSWGRFWGWDPKENGALIIVLWNAVILHARWGGMVKSHGMAILAILGNIVVSWSWFGVNELGVGLHSYGFTEGRLKWLAIFAISQLVLALLGMAIPRSAWISSLTGSQGLPSLADGPEIAPGLILEDAPNSSQSSRDRRRNRKNP